MKNRYRLLVQPQLPRAGLGNMLLVWARALVFADLNSLPMSKPNWEQFRLGPYLRGERDRRDYFGLFDTSNYVAAPNWLAAKLAPTELVYNPLPVALPSAELAADRTFIFNEVPHWDCYFEYLTEAHSLIVDRLMQDLRPHVRAQIDARPAPQIGLHLRMGDFNVLPPGVDFATVGQTRTPLDWFASVINFIRDRAGWEVPVTLFSDGRDDELEPLLCLSAVSRPPQAGALADLLTLAKSKTIVASSGSTFSQWAAYIGRCPTIYHPAHFHAGVFSVATSATVFEGGFDPRSMSAPDLLRENLSSLFS